VAYETSAAAANQAVTLYDDFSYLWVCSRRTQCVRP
jgi:hypothetical protein